MFFRQHLSILLSSLRIVRYINTLVLNKETTENHTTIADPQSSNNRVIASEQNKLHNNKQTDRKNRIETEQHGEQKQITFVDLKVKLCIFHELPPQLGVIASPNSFFMKE